MSGPRTRKVQYQHQRSSSTGSHGLLFGIGAAAGLHNPHHAVFTSPQVTSPSPDTLTSDEEESEELDVRGKANQSLIYSFKSHS